VLINYCLVSHSTEILSILLSQEFFKGSRQGHC
jgi:hypothetical protein